MTRQSSPLRRSVRKLRSLSGRAGKRLERLVQARALVLVYHRITEGQPDPWALNVTTEHFCEHLDVLRTRLRPLALTDLERHLRRGTIPRRGVVVTFDDGYADNLYNGAPALERAGVPATIFVTTGQLLAPRGFWWDDLELIILRTPQLPESLELTIAGRRYSFDVAAGDTAAATSTTALDRAALYQRLWAVLRELDATRRPQALQHLRAWATTAGAVAETAHPPLSVGELHALAKSPLIDIGAHTVNHPSLPALPLDVQRQEIHASKRQLEDIIGKPVTHFAYPHGTYTAETVDVVREAGYATASSSMQAAVVRSSDRYQLPRIPVLDWDGEQLAREISRWIPLRRRWPRRRGEVTSSTSVPDAPRSSLDSMRH